MRSGDIRPWAGDMARPFPDDEVLPPDAEVVSDEGGSNLWLLILGMGDRVPPADDKEAELDPTVKLPRIDPPTDGELERTLSGGGLMRLLGSATPSPDMPGKRILPVTGVVSDISP